MNYFEEYSNTITLKELLEGLRDSLPSIEGDKEIKHSDIKIYFEFHRSLKFSIESDIYKLSFYTNEPGRNDNIELSLYKKGIRKHQKLEFIDSESLKSIQNELLKIDSIEKIFFNELLKNGVNIALEKLND